MQMGFWNPPKVGQTADVDDQCGRVNGLLVICNKDCCVESG